MSEEATETAVAESTDDTTTSDAEETSLLTSETETTEDKTDDTTEDKTDKSTLLTDETEDKTDDKTEGEKKETEETDGAPEKYEAFTAPEGVTLDEAMLEKFSDLARESNMPQESAQQFIDMAVKVMAQQAEAQQSNWTEIREGWETEIKADKDFGGAKFAETLEGAKRILNTYGTPELRSVLNWGVGSNPELIKMLSRIDKVTREDSSAGDGGKTVIM